MNLDSWKLKNPKYILDWDEVEKGMMIGYVSLIITLWDLLCLATIYFIGSYFDVSPAHRITEFGFRYSMIAGSAYACICLLSLVVGSYIRHATKRIKHYFMYIGMSVYTIGNIFLIHMFGELSTTSGIIVAGAPIVGWVLFETRGVMIATTIGVIGVIGAFGLSFFQMTPYAPLVSSNYPAHQNISYIIGLVVVISPHLAALLFLSHSSIIHWKKREEDASYLAGIDSLTNIPNRRQIKQLFQQSISRGISQDTPISVAMFDLDSFKNINDTYGHHIGDQVLNTCVNLVQKQLRSQDLLGRLGGDEFFIIMPNTAKSDAITLSQNCLNQLRDTPIAIDNFVLETTASFGVITLEYINDTDMAIDTIMESSFIKVDQALYEAKQNGRNQVVFG